MRFEMLGFAICVHCRHDNYYNVEVTSSVTFLQFG